MVGPVRHRLLRFHFRGVGAELQQFSGRRWAYVTLLHIRGFPSLKKISHFVGTYKRDCYDNANIPLSPSVCTGLFDGFEFFVLCLWRGRLKLVREVDDGFQGKWSNSNAGI